MAKQLVAPTRRERRAAERADRPRGPRHAPAVRRRFSLEKLTAIALVGGIGVVALAIAFGARPSTPSAHTEVAVAFAPAGVATDGFVIGSPDAAVTIELYEDFQCPACELWGQTVFPTLAANELADGTVRVVFHDVAFLGQESTDAGMAAYAAGQQGRFWDMWATLYANQGHENSGAFSRERLVAMADHLGLDVARFEVDMDSSEATAALAASKAAAGRVGVTSTPTLIVDGQVLLGVRPYPELAAAIAAAASAAP
ncbi:MAG TPA: thioredoxin domain-containing protein [Candidatus Limnocylindrales bacterium]